MTDLTVKPGNESLQPPPIKTATRVITFAQQKGGVGKTTTCLSIGAVLAHMGHRVLLIDMDPQANLSMSLGVDVYTLERSAYHVLKSPHLGIDRSLLHTDIPNLDVIPAELDLAAADQELADKPEREFHLKRALTPTLQTGYYDFILIDPPPSLDIFTMSALTAAHYIVIPMPPHVYPLHALERLERTITFVQEFNSGYPKIGGIVISMYDGRYKLSRQVEEEVKREFGELVFQTRIPMSSKVAEAPASGQPINLYAPGSPGALAYEELAKEFVTRFATT